MFEDDYKAAREDAAVVKKDAYGLVQLTGSERVSWLQGMVTNDVQKIRPGEGIYAAHLSPQGKMIAHMLILADRDRLWLELERSRHLREQPASVGRYSSTRACHVMLLFVFMMSAPNGREDARQAGCAGG